MARRETYKKTLLTALKKCLHSAKGKWVDEVLGVLWAYRTTSLKLTGVSLFTLTYGIEAIIPIEIGVPTLIAEIPENANTKAIAKDLDMIDELREAVALCIALYKQRIEKLYNRCVKQHAFRAIDLVLIKAFENTTNIAANKFQLNWEGPYVIVRVGAAGSYALNKLYGTLVPRMWNAMHLKMYYQ